MKHHVPLRKTIQLILLSELLSRPVCSQHLPAKSTGDLQFYFDTAGFRSSLGNTYQEFYYQIPLELMAFFEANGKLVDTLTISLTLQDESNDTLYQKDWTTPVLAEAGQELVGRFIPEQFDLLLKPGRYEAHLSMQEQHTHRSGKAMLAFNAKEFNLRHLALSSIQFASDIRQDSSNGKFKKTGWRFCPIHLAYMGRPCCCWPFIMKSTTCLFSLIPQSSCRCNMRF
jgi:hypothetical protein